ncbi:MAG: aldose 1-epimerase family protein [Acetivibrio sp.]
MMSQEILENQRLRVTINNKGAEIQSIFGKEEKREYIWKGDSNYWGRSAPVLFPVVGNFKNKEYVYEEKTYKMNQHGFARDRQFDIFSKTETEIWYLLKEDEESLKIYPFRFHLYLGYRLHENQLEVLWKVENTNQKELYFSIGGHPAFMCPLTEGEKQSDYYLQFNGEDDLLYSLIDETGLVAYENNLLPLDEEGSIQIPAHLFDRDALIIENQQATKVSLLDSKKNPYITLTFHAPLFGIWSPAKKNAPFVCIEPWYGRSDSKDFNGTLKERQYGNTLKPKETFEAAYTIMVGQ